MKTGLVSLAIRAAVGVAMPVLSSCCLAAGVATGREKLEREEQGRPAGSIPGAEEAGRIAEERQVWRPAAGENTHLMVEMRNNRVLHLLDYHGHGHGLCCL